MSSGFGPKSETELNFFSQEEIEGVFEKHQPYQQPSYYKYSPTNSVAFLKKLDKYNKDTETEIDVKRYQTVYALSDIHADYQKFLTILFDCGIINYPTEIVDSSVVNYRDKIGNDNGIYHIDLILKCEWNLPNTLLVIVGDLLDGKRNRGAVNDQRGYFEIFLLIFIFNLKHKAKKMSSDIKIIIGNHDILLLNDNHYYDINEEDPITYVHYKAQYFFSNINNNKSVTVQKNRKHILLPFFVKCGLFQFHIKCNKKNVLSFVHGSFHSNGGKTLPVKKWMSFITLNNISQLKKNIEYDFVWDRTYIKTKKDEELNKLLGDDDTTYIVGHCTTWLLEKNEASIEQSHSNIDAHIQNKCKYTHVNSKNKKIQKGTDGCIYPRCFFPGTNTPKIILVDTGLSSAFLEDNRKQNIQNITEILKINIAQSDKQVCPEIKFYRVRHNHEKETFEEKLITNPDLPLTLSLTLTDELIKKPTDASTPELLIVRKSSGGYHQIRKRNKSKKHNKNINRRKKKCSKRLKK
jgi:hypothetical protein